MTFGSSSKFPTTTGDPLDEWSSGTNLKTDDGNASFEGTVGESEDTSDYKLHVPPRATEIGIIIEVEGGWFDII